jgi:hypothetical protein
MNINKIIESVLLQESLQNKKTEICEKQNLRYFRYHFTYRITHCRALNIVYSSDQQCNHLEINFDYLLIKQLTYPI